MNLNTCADLTEFCGLAKKLDESAQEGVSKYYKKFDFFYRRTAFRSMTEFYKLQFKPVMDLWREGERKSAKNFTQYFLGQNSNFDHIFEQATALGQASSTYYNRQRKVLTLEQQKSRVETITHDLYASLKDSFAHYQNDEPKATSEGQL